MIEAICNKVRSNQFEFSQHAVDQTVLRHVTVLEIREAFAGCEIIEDYPTDKYGPSCLLFGKTGAGRPLHIQCSYPTRPLLKIITVYEPDPSQWVDFKVRKT
jgi:Domain of unknown function (DUF4258)